MNIDRILEVLNAGQVEYLLIGGVNFLLRHGPDLTYDVDVWIHDTEDNRRRCEATLAALGAEWSRDEEDWGPVARRPAGWLSEQSLYCMTSPCGALDVFRSVTGLPDWETCAARGISGRTASGTTYRGLGDEDMLACQMGLPPQQRKAERMRVLRAALEGKTSP